MKSQGTKGKLLWGLGGCAFLLGSLIMHIYFTTNSIDQGHTNWQLSRIDFKEPIDSVQAGNIVSFVRSMDGVTKANFNTDCGTLVYAYFPGTLNSEQVYKRLQEHGHYNAERHIVSSEMASSGCPVMSGGEVSRRLALYFGRLFG